MNFTRFSRRPRYLFDMTPMIDVVMQLIIFFLFTTQFSHLVRTPVDLPHERGEDRPTGSGTPIVLDVDKDGRLILEGRPIDLGTFVDAVGAEIAREGGDPAGIRVLVRADRNSPAMPINRVAEQLAALGVRAWQLGTHEPGTP